jgi:integrating conjugative element protein (TIGR03756 family)
MMRRLFLAGALLASQAQGAETNSAEIIASTLNPAMLPCLDHCIVGTCIWLRPIPTPPYFKVETKLKVRHKFPDIVVSVFEHAGDNPWLEMRTLSAAAAVASQAYGGLSSTIVTGGRETNANNQDTRDSPGVEMRRDHQRFAEAEIYGHPLASVIGQSPLGFGVAIPGLCPIKTRSFFPYYQSGVDVMSWRNPEVELLYPASWIPYLRDVRDGSFTNNWGPVFPRHGAIASQSSPYRAYAVLAQRAADITTNALSPHIYIRAPGDASDERRDKWQRVTSPPSLSCGSFGGFTESTLTASLDDNQTWQLWRPYECCLPNPGAVLVGQINLPTPICLLSALTSSPDTSSGN